MARSPRLAAPGLRGLRERCRVDDLVADPADTLDLQGDDVAGNQRRGDVLPRAFQGWLQGYNGGPLRMPTQRIHDHQMAALRKGLLDAGLAPSMDPFREFFIGRNPA